MFVTNYQVVVGTRYGTTLPANASLEAKLRETTKDEGTRKPHARVELAFGTGQTKLNRVSCYDFQGSMPTSPVLLGPQERETYTAAMAATAGSAPWVAAISKGAATILGGWALAMLAGKLLPLASAAIGAAIATPFAAGVTVIGVCVAGLQAGLYTLGKWQLAHDRFRDLRTLTEHSSKLSAKVPLTDDEKKAGQDLVKKGLHGKDWVLREAAEEYEQRLQRAGAPRAWPMTHVVNAANQPVVSELRETAATQTTVQGHRPLTLGTRPTSVSVGTQTEAAV